MKYWIECMKKYATFKGRARRKEYWMFALFYTIFMIALYVPGFFMESSAGLVYLNRVGMIYPLIFALPSIAVMVRRLHDIGKSGWWQLLALVPFVGPIIILVFCCLDSQPGANAYGENPKGVQS